MFMYINRNTDKNTFRVPYSGVLINSNWNHLYSGIHKGKVIFRKANIMTKREYGIGKSKYKEKIKKHGTCILYMLCICEISSC